MLLDVLRVTRNIWCYFFVSRLKTRWFFKFCCEHVYMLPVSARVTWCVTIIIFITDFSLLHPASRFGSYPIANLHWASTRIGFRELFLWRNEGWKWDMALRFQKMTFISHKRWHDRLIAIGGEGFQAFRKHLFSKDYMHSPRRWHPKKYKYNITCLSILKPISTT